MPLKRIFIIIISVFAVINSYSQNKSDSIKLAKLEVIKASLTNNKALMIGKLPVSSVKVLDARYDTVTLGFVDGNKRVVPLNLLSSDIEGYIHQNYTLANGENNNYRLVILLEQLWLTSTFETGVAQKQDVAVLHKDILGEKHEPKSDDAATINNAALVKAKIMIAIGDEYHPFYQVDDYYIQPQNVEWLFANKIIENVVDTLLYKVVNHNIDELKYKKTSATLSEVKAYVNTRFSMPVISSATHARGVFVTFDEFKNNSPSIKDFSVEKNDKEDILNVSDEHGNIYPLRNFFGYSDGENMYIYKGDRFSRLFKEDNTFIFWGTNSGVIIYHKNWKNVAAGVALFGINGANLLTAPRFKKKAMAFQLDMETGDCY